MQLAPFESVVYVPKLFLRQIKLLHESRKCISKIAEDALADISSPSSWFFANTQLLAPSLLNVVPISGS